MLRRQAGQQEQVTREVESDARTSVKGEWVDTYHTAPSLQLRQKRAKNGLIDILTWTSSIKIFISPLLYPSHFKGTTQAKSGGS